MKGLFNLFNRSGVKHLYADMKPADRIATLMNEFVFPGLKNEGFKYSKSKRLFKKTNEFFEFHVSWYTRKFNHGNTIVEFDMYINIFSTKYMLWEKAFYNLEESSEGAIDGTRVDYIDGWDKTYYDNGWYNLVKYDNEALMKKVSENILSAGFSFFEKYASFDSAIEELKKHHIMHFETIVDLYLIQDRYKEALGFFEANNQWHEERLNSDQFEYHSQFIDNRKVPYLKRKEKLMAWAQHNNHHSV